MWERQIMEKKSFLFLQVRSSGEEQVELRRLQVQLALNNRRRCLNLVCLLLLLIPQRISQFLRFSSLLSSVSSIFNSLFFSLKSMTSSMPPNCLLSSPFTPCLHSHRFQYAYRSGLSTSKYISCSRRKRNTSLPALPAILFQQIKTSCVRMTKIGNVQNSG